MRRTVLEWTQLGAFAFFPRLRSWAAGYPARLATLQAVTFGMRMLLTLVLVFGEDPTGATLGTVLTSALMWPFMRSWNRA